MCQHYSTSFFSCTLSVENVKKKEMCFFFKCPSGLTVSQVKVIGGPGGPQPHGVHSVVHVAGDGCVIRHRQNHLQQWMWQFQDKSCTDKLWRETWNFIFPARIFMNLKKSCISKYLICTTCISLWSFYLTWSFNIFVSLCNKIRQPDWSAAAIISTASVPGCPPIWSHLSSLPLVHRSGPATCTPDVLSPTGFRASANHLPPPPTMGRARAKIKSCTSCCMQRLESLSKTSYQTKAGVGNEGFAVPNPAGSVIRLDCAE